MNRQNSSPALAIKLDAGVVDSVLADHDTADESTSESETAISTTLHLSPAVRAAKRLVDLTLASAGLLILSPLMLIVALIIRLDSPGPVIYAQARVGQQRRRGQRPFRGSDHRVDNLMGTPFTIYKFRTMRQDAEAASGPVWARRKDPRITRIGKFLRRTRIDELPQLWNVVRGEMSFVGPRPERPHFVKQLIAEVPRYGERLVVTKPGITGLAQVSCSYDTSLASVRRKLRYDLHYCESLSSLPRYLVMELKILWRTVETVLSGRGAH
ncbi:MAG: sugar transferase [Myxococcales bacterium]|nr:sugar transferase [Myxococcales bacterium]